MQVYMQHFCKCRNQSKASQRSHNPASTQVEHCNCSLYAELEQKLRRTFFKYINIKPVFGE